MRWFHAARSADLEVVVAAAVAAVLCTPAQAALYQCTSATGEILFTDAGCPPGFTTDLIIPEAVVASPEPPARRDALGVPGDSAPHPPHAAEAEAARLKVELENARLRSELEQERLRAIDRKLDALLEAQPVYGAVGLVPFGAAPRPFPVCRPGQTPWVHCRPPRRHDLKAKDVVDERPACGIAGCTPGIIRLPDRDDASRVVR